MRCCFESALGAGFVSDVPAVASSGMPLLKRIHRADGDATMAFRNESEGRSQDSRFSGDPPMKFTRLWFHVSFERISPSDTHFSLIVVILRILDRKGRESRGHIPC